MSPLASPAALGAAWFVLVLTGAWRRRPRASRLARLLPASHGVKGGRRSTVERLGGAVRRVARRRPFGRGSAAPPDSSLAHEADDPHTPETVSGHRAADRRVGVTVIVACLAAAVSVWLAPLVLVGAWAGSAVRRRRAARRRVERIADDLPDVVDLFTLAAGAGLTVALSIEAVARHTPGPIGAALAGAVRRQRLGERSADALSRVPAEVGEAVRPLTNALMASERYGTALVPALEALAEEVGRQRRRRAEERARRAPVKLIFPLVLCSLPAFALLTVVPLLLSTLGSLRF